MGGITINNSNHYNIIQLKIELNKRGYNDDDVNFLFKNTASTKMFKDNSNNLKIEHEHHPSAVGKHFFTITFIITTVFTQIGSGFLQQLGTNLYNWSKKTVRSLIMDKPYIDNSYILFKFKGREIFIFLNKEEDSSIILENFEHLVKYAEILNTTNQDTIDINVDNFKEYLKL